MVACNHGVNAQQRKQREREQLAAALQHLPLCRVGAGINQRSCQCQRGKAFHPTAKGISQHHAAKAVEGFGKVRPR